MTSAKKTIALLPGDGIGPEVTRAAVSVLEGCAAEFGHRFESVELPIGGTAIDRSGSPLPQETLEGCHAADAVLLGAVGGPRWDDLPVGRRPESGLLALRQELGLYANVRPICLRAPLRGLCPLEAERAREIDFEIVRELAGGIYFGTHETHEEDGQSWARDVETYGTAEIERIARFALVRAEARRKRLASVDKANVLASSALWRATVARTAQAYPEVALQHLYVDNAALQLVLAPQQFDVLLTSNLFGDILSDEGAALAGSIGLIPSLSWGLGTPLYEPIHGSAPSLAGKDCACPIGAILCVSMMLRESFGLATEAEWIETAVDRVLAHGYRTADIGEPGSTVVGCSALTQQIRTEMQESLRHVERYGWGV